MSSDFTGMVNEGSNAGKVRAYRVLEFKVYAQKYEVVNNQLWVTVTETEAKRLAAAYHEAIKEDDSASQRIDPRD